MTLQTEVRPTDPPDDVSADETVVEGKQRKAGWILAAITVLAFVVLVVVLWIPGLSFNWYSNWRATQAFNQQLALNKQAGALASTVGHLPVTGPTNAGAGYQMAVSGPTAYVQMSGRSQVFSSVSPNTTPAIDLGPQPSHYSGDYWQLVPSSAGPLFAYNSAGSLKELTGAEASAQICKQHLGCPLWNFMAPVAVTADAQGNVYSVMLPNGSKTLTISKISIDGSVNESWAKIPASVSSEMQSDFGLDALAVGADGTIYLSHLNSRNADIASRVDTISSQGVFTIGARRFPKTVDVPAVKNSGTAPSQPFVNSYWSLQAFALDKAGNMWALSNGLLVRVSVAGACLLYTSDAADE